MGVLVVLERLQALGPVEGGLADQSGFAPVVAFRALGAQQFEQEAFVVGAIAECFVGDVAEAVADRGQSKFRAAFVDLGVDGVNARGGLPGTGWSSDAAGRNGCRHARLPLDRFSSWS